MMQKLIPFFDRMFTENRSNDLTAMGSENYQVQDYSLDKLQRLDECNTNFIIEMLQIYLQNADKDISELKASCKAGDWTRTGTKAHKLIPACKYLQINKLTRHLEDIEIESKNVQDQNRLVRLVTQACDTYSKVRPIILSDLQKLKKDQLQLGY